MKRLQETSSIIYIFIIYLFISIIFSFSKPRHFHQMPYSGIADKPHEGIDV